MSNQVNDQIIDKIIDGQELTEEEKELDVDAYPEMKVEQAYEEHQRGMTADELEQSLMRLKVILGR